MWQNCQLYKKRLYLLHKTRFNIRVGHMRAIPEIVPSTLVLEYLRHQGLTPILPPFFLAFLYKQNILWYLLYNSFKIIDNNLRNEEGAVWG